MHLESKSGFRIRMFDSAPDGWDTFVRSHKGCSVYHLSCWMQIICKVFGHETIYLIAQNEQREINGVLPIIRIKSRLFGNYMVSIPYLSYGGACGESEDIEASLIRAAGDVAATNRSRHIEFRDDANRHTNSAVRLDKVMMQLELPDCPDELWKSFKAKVRSQIRRPQREGASVRLGGSELLGDFYEIFAIKMRELGTPVYPIAWFQEIFSQFDGDKAVLLIDVKGKPAGGAILIGFRNRMEVPWAATLPRYNPIGVNMAMYWEMLKWSITRNYRVFDFGRCSKNSGTYRFKKQWGAVPRQLYWYYWLKRGSAVPNLTPNNPRYQIAIAIWRRLPLSITKSLGPKILAGLS